MKSARTAFRRTTARVGLTIVAVTAPVLLVGCSSGSSTAEPSASEAESTSVGTTAGSAECAATAWYGNQDGLFGREWLLAYKKNPSTSGVSLSRCHYVHNPNSDDDQSAPDASNNAMTGDLVPPPVIIPGGSEVQKILLDLPDSTDPSLWRCIGPQPVVDFDEFTVLDQSGTSVAKFQTSEGGNGCGMFRVIPST